MLIENGRNDTIVVRPKIIFIKLNVFDYYIFIVLLILLCLSNYVYKYIIVN
jgi:hypothetical protein